MTFYLAAWRFMNFHDLCPDARWLLRSFSLPGDDFAAAKPGLASGAADSLVQLIGVTTATALGGAAAATMIHIV